MNDYEKVEFALDILETAEVIHEFDDCVWVKIDRNDWETLWFSPEVSDETEEWGEIPRVDRCQ